MYKSKILRRISPQNINLKFVFAYREKMRVPTHICGQLSEELRELQKFDIKGLENCYGEHKRMRNNFPQINYCSLQSVTFVTYEPLWDSGCFLHKNAPNHIFYIATV